MTSAGAPLPLEGITVVALEQAVAAPFATRQLADQGARVVKVERVDGGDFARAYDTGVRGGLGTHFAWLNRSKESVALDLKRDEGRAVLADLVARADVFLQNLAPGAAARLGFGAEELRARDPRLIVVEMSGYGTRGPYRDKRAYDMLVQAEAGLISVTGTPETPVKAGSPTSRPACTPSPGRSPRSCGAAPPARARRSRSRCSTRSPSGWARRCTRRSTPAPRRRARGWATL
ncbi:crotonobetainyl-CoA:carnitine CoA-transferase CaiB-like acyl-CoA transferase [Actinomadura luteofluorescens]|uniref:Crotonobetainyl-CoA:carnitine CoA-transferase CaiB-like acyl-CoA transferase n=1 Tax=Actinomadura luteofluorescens TaxID=46163 RepID=A0A7Y9EQF1_9ACTN|nr:crotonobetainyl-CoA:carnitine CoA-transferase CaiB-like acyl-CoA transferase [Actinomadura luteofluorescens]